MKRTPLQKLVSRQSERLPRDAIFSWSLRSARKQVNATSGPSAPVICAGKKLSIMKKKIPTFKSDREAEAFVDTADLTKYDLSGAKPVRFEFEKKGARVNMRLPEPLLKAVKSRARARGIPYQRFIREALEGAVARNKR